MSKKKFYTVLDTETATIKAVNGLSEKDRKKIATSFPLVYDLGFVFVNGKGEILETRSFLIEEIYRDEELFNTAYYKNKKSIYEQKIERGEIEVVPLMTALRELEKFADKSELLCASNAAFDFKKALPFTMDYVYHYYYRKDGEEWIQKINAWARNIVNGVAATENYKPLTPQFTLFQKQYGICDLWGIGVERLANNSRYKKFCLKNGYLTNSGQYFSSTVETLYKYLKKNKYFVEKHMALEDAIDESYILKKILKKGGISAGMRPFPFKVLGNTFDFVQTETNKKYIKAVKKAIYRYLKTTNSNNSSYVSKLRNVLGVLEELE